MTGKANGYNQHVFVLPLLTMTGMTGLAYQTKRAVLDHLGSHVASYLSCCGWPGGQLVPIWSRLRAAIAS